jgi:hypothetical protein
VFYYGSLYLIDQKIATMNCWFCRVDSLCVLLALKYCLNDLYKADYNLVLALQARKLVHNAEDNRLLNKSLYGARPGRTAHDPVGLEEFVGEITRLSRKPLIKNAEDATACYDRIIPGIGNLASRSFGMHRFIALVQGRTLEEVKYHLKTKLGVSEENYQHCWTDELQTRRMATSE